MSQPEQLNVEKEARTIDTISKIFIITSIQQDEMPERKSEDLLKRNLLLAYLADDLPSPAKCLEQRKRIFESASAKAIEMAKLVATQAAQASSGVH